ncbi:hypothetical protein PsorP6_009635 [Peronosclerospora sorghi]|uniref:Uncharacterized protein n=1 Tax=Peronosclerospora sorghi TaxID=230839 RepID=A0ACC0VZZ3_9STRA|nr:hypothetical protein PsorP6_009635 [Peronosclerospora sorghi]
MHFLFAAAAVAMVNADDTVFSGIGKVFQLGDPDTVTCNTTSLDPDFAKTYYAALNQQQWDEASSCGRCALISCVNGVCVDSFNSVLVEIRALVTKCPACREGDLELPSNVFSKFPDSTSSEYNIQWSFASCSR